MKKFDTKVTDNQDKTIQTETEEFYTIPERWKDVVLMTGEGRDERWIEDIKQLRDAIYKWHPMFNATEAIFIPRGLLENGEAGRLPWTDAKANILRREAFNVALDELIELVPTLIDMQIAFGIQHAIAKLGDNHFNIFQQEGFPDSLGETRLPVTFMYLGGAEGGYYLVETLETATDVLNQRLMSVGGVSIEEVERRFADIWSLDVFFN